ncbi:MAG: nuclear transport factor 2 family protein [Ilumatobacteraceae bacterium]
MDDATAVRALTDRAAVADLLTSFSIALDSCDWAGYRGVFTDEIDLDYSSWSAGAVGRWSADDWVARAAASFPGFTATRHALTKVLVTLDPADPDRARVRADVCAEHVVADVTGETHVFTVNGWYDDGCVRTPSGWRIDAKRLVVRWTTGDRGIMDLARTRTAARLGRA